MVTGLLSNIFWKDKDMEVEDTAIELLKTKKGKVASIFCSWRLHQVIFLSN